jgi:hypothetical protein
MCLWERSWASTQYPLKGDSHGLLLRSTDKIFWTTRSLSCIPLADRPLESKRSAFPGIRLYATKRITKYLGTLNYNSPICITYMNRRIIPNPVWMANFRRSAKEQNSEGYGMKPRDFDIVAVTSPRKLRGMFKYRRSLRWDFNAPTSNKVRVTSFNIVVSNDEIIT